MQACELRSQSTPLCLPPQLALCLLRDIVGVLVQMRMLIASRCNSGWQWLIADTLLVELLYVMLMVIADKLLVEMLTCCEEMSDSSQLRTL